LSLEGAARLFWAYKAPEPVVPPGIGQFDEKRFITETRAEVNK
jgi:hypothetical protein